MEKTNPFPPGSKLRPDAILPDFEIYLKSGSEYIKQQMCTELGESVPHNGQSPSARVSLAEEALYIMLPKHRIFLQLNKNKKFKPINGMVQLPTIGTYFSSKEHYMTPGSIIEVDKHYVTSDSYFKWQRDINHKLVPPATYLFVGQLILWRGADVTTVSYCEHVSIGPILRKISNLSPWISALEQVYTSIQRNPQHPSQIKHVGDVVLKTASQINYGNQYLVDKAHGSFKHRKPHGK